MLFAGDSTFVSFGIGSMIVVAVAMVGSITAVPAALALLGSKIDRGRLPFIGKRMTAPRGGRALLARRRRRVAASPAAQRRARRRPARRRWRFPAFSMHTALSGTSDLPRDLPVMRVYERLQAAFPGGQIPAEVVVRSSDLQSPRMRAAIAELERRALAERPVQRARRGDGRPRRQGRVDPDPDGGRRQRRGVDARAADGARDARPADASARSPAPRRT